MMQTGWRNSSSSVSSASATPTGAWCIGRALAVLVALPLIALVLRVPVASADPATEVGTDTGADPRDGRDAAPAWPQLQRPLIDGLFEFDPGLREWIGDPDPAAVRVLPGRIHVGRLELMPLSCTANDRIALALFETTGRRVMAVTRLPGEADSLVVGVADLTGSGRAELDVVATHEPTRGRRITEQRIFAVSPDPGDPARVVLRRLLRVATRESLRSDPGPHLERRARLAWVDTNGDGQREARIRREEVETTGGPDFRPLDWSRVVTEELWSPDDDADGVFTRRHQRVLAEPSPAELVRLARWHERAGHFARAGAAARRCVERYGEHDLDRADARQLAIARMIAHRYPAE